MSAPGRLRARIDRDRREKFKQFRIKSGLAVDAPFWHTKPLAVETYEEALDAGNYAEEGNKQEPGKYDEIMEASYVLAERCLDVMEPGWRGRV